MSQLVPGLSNPTIGNLYNDWVNGILDIQPSFQRKFVWTSHHQEKFIETILKGFPFPEIYIATGETDRRTLRTTSMVIDGQQRLTTIFKYIKGNELFTSDQIPNFDSLEEPDITNFLSYKVVIRDLGKIDDETIKEVFRRINLTKFHLEDIEIQNAVYNGEFISTAKECLQFTEVLNDLEIFNDVQLSRMADLQYMLLIMSTIENEGYFAQNQKIENFVIKFNSEYENKANITQKIAYIFNYIKQLDINNNSIWGRKSNFFTLFIELARCIDNLPRFEHMKAKLEEFENLVLESKISHDEYYFKYYNSMLQGTNHRSNRVIRGGYVNSLIQQALD